MAGIRIQAAMLGTTRNVSPKCSEPCKAPEENAPRTKLLVSSGFDTATTSNPTKDSVNPSHVIRHAPPTTARARTSQSDSAPGGADRKPPANPATAARAN